MAEDGPGYREFNFSPSGEWAVYAFRSYREGGELDVELAPGIVVRRSSNRLQLGAEICQDLLPSGRALRLGCPRSSKMSTARCLTGRCAILRASPTSITLTPLRCHWNCLECET